MQVSSRSIPRAKKVAALLAHGGRGLTPRVTPDIRLFLPVALHRHYWTGVHPDADLLSFLASELRPGNTFFDVGANIGLYSITLAKQFFNGIRVVGFEPCDSTVGWLRRMIDLNGAKGVEVVPLALSRRARDLTLSAYGDGRNNFVVDHSEASIPTQSVHAVALDEYCATHQIFPDALKIDVEGHELDVIKGGTETLRRFRPALVIECHCASWPSSDYATELTETLRHCGYSVLCDRTRQPIKLREAKETVHLLAPRAA
jgi:FkbM family methyltransferase